MGAVGKPGGFLITFEGPEGSGKSTQIQRLEQALRGHGLPVISTREPGGTHLGEQVRELLLTKGPDRITGWAEALLFTAARAELVQEVIRPGLDAGDIVLCDRYGDSTLAYQGYGRQLDLDTLRSLQAAATGGLTPDLTLLLRLPVTVGLSRIPAAARDRLDREAEAFHERVLAGYDAMALRDPSRWRVVDATAGPVETARVIQDQVMETLRRVGRLNAGRRSA